MTSWTHLTVERNEQSGVPIYRLSGNLTDSRDAYRFLKDFREEISALKPIKGVIFNLENIDHINSGGVGVLAACYTTVTNAGGRLCLAAVQHRAMAVLQVVGLLGVIDCADTEDALMGKLGDASGSIDYA